MVLFYKGVVGFFDEVVLELLDNNNKDNFYVDIKHSLDECFEYFIRARPLGYLLEVTFGE